MCHIVATDNPARPYRVFCDDCLPLVHSHYVPFVVSVKALTGRQCDSCGKHLGERKDGPDWPEVAECITP